MIPLALANIFVTGIFILAGQERLMTWVGVVAIAATLFFMRKPKAAPKRAATSKVIHAS